MSTTRRLTSDNAWPLWNASFANPFHFEDDSVALESLVVSSVTQPWLFYYAPSEEIPSNGRSVLILGGGGYVQLMVGKEGVLVARWLASLGFHAFVLVHRFPSAGTGPQAPVDDARRALVIMKEVGLGSNGFGICGLSSGGHLAAALLAKYPSTWESPGSCSVLPKLDFAIIGYGPISTNAAGRTIIEGKAPLTPPEKQELYDLVQPDVQLLVPAPPTFIVYSGNDNVVPVVNAYRLAEGLTRAGAKVELHVFADAPHGFALEEKGLPVGKWPEMCEAWFRQGGFL